MKRIVAGLSISVLIGAGIITAYANDNAKSKVVNNNVDLVKSIESDLQSALSGKFGSNWDTTLDSKYGDDWEDLLDSKYGRDWDDKFEVEINKLYPEKDLDDNNFNQDVVIDSNTVSSIEKDLQLALDNKLGVNWENILDSKYGDNWEGILDSKYGVYWDDKFEDKINRLYPQLSDNDDKYDIDNDDMNDNDNDDKYDIDNDEYDDNDND